MLQCGMRLINRSLLSDFALQQPTARSWVENWAADVGGALWKTPQEIKDRYKTVSFVGNLVIFNVVGNSFRLVVKISYNNSIVFVHWVGTHAEYDRVNWKSESNHV
jgi:mRNA interferase HigB